MSSPAPAANRLWVVTVIANPNRYQSRYRLYRDFARHVEHSGANLLTVEIAFGDRNFEVTQSDNPNHVQLRTWTELWHKERALCIGMGRIPDNSWEYAAWIDADISFARPNWAEETVHLLQHVHVAQLFSVALDLGPRYEPFQSHTGFVYSYLEGRERGRGYTQWHPGFAWAASREFLDAVGGLMDFPILGAADHHMACALIGSVFSSVHGGVTESYKRRAKQWQDRAVKFARKDIGYLPGAILHHWHGSKTNRRYIERWKVLTENAFDPDLDLIRDTQGLWQLSDRNYKLRDGLRAYFAQRDEDSNCLPDHEVRFKF